MAFPLAQTARAPYQATYYIIVCLGDNTPNNRTLGGHRHYVDIPLRRMSSKRFHQFHYHHPFRMPLIYVDSAPGTSPAHHPPSGTAARPPRGHRRHITRLAALPRDHHGDIAGTSPA